MTAYAYIQEDRVRLNHPGSRGDQKLQHSPVALFVKFEKEGAPQEWELAGLEGQPGVYCVSKQPEYWYVDGKGVMSRGLGWSNKGCHHLLCSRWRIKGAAAPVPCGPGLQPHRILHARIHLASVLS